MVEGLTQEEKANHFKGEKRLKIKAIITKHIVTKGDKYLIFPNNEENRNLIMAMEIDGEASCLEYSAGTLPCMPDHGWEDGQESSRWPLVLDAAIMHGWKKHSWNYWIHPRPQRLAAIQNTITILVYKGTGKKGGVSFKKNIRHTKPKKVSNKYSFACSIFPASMNFEVYW